MIYFEEGGHKQVKQNMMKMTSVRKPVLLPVAVYISNVSKEN